MQLYITFAFALCLGAFGTWIVLKYGAVAGLIDNPNDRSSHEVATPRGGGIAIVVTILFLVALGWLLGVIEQRVAAAVVVAATLVGGVGFLDDLMSLRAKTRLFIHFLASFLVLVIWAPYLLNLGLSLGVVSAIACLLAMVWSLNLYNFMDGIDGLAGMQGVFFAVSGVALLIVVGEPDGWSLILTITAGACGGFLLFNLAPARIFMGDGGSGFLGLLFALVALDTVFQEILPLVSWLLIGGAFLTDATVTLCRRAFTGQQIAEAHRTHAYQHLARQLGNHRSVTFIVTAVNIFWLLPLAFAASTYPNLQWYLLFIGLSPLVLCEIVIGAGKQEVRSG